MFTKAKITIGIAIIRKHIQKIMPFQKKAHKLVDWAFDFMERVPGLLTKLNDNHHEDLAPLLGALMGTQSAIKSSMKAVELHLGKEPRASIVASAVMATYGVACGEVSKLLLVFADLEQRGIIKKMKGPLKDILLAEQRKLNTILGNKQAKRARRTKASTVKSNAQTSQKNSNEL